MKKLTNAELIAENAALKESLDVYRGRDLAVRTDLSKLLESYKYESVYGYGKEEKKVDVQPWVGIAFLIGQLKADANYSNVLMQKDKQTQEISELSLRIHKLENPSANEPS